jgi:hypothetical protein
MNSCILNDILLKSDRFTPIAKNPLLKDLKIPAGYFINNIHYKSTPILYNNCSDCVDDKCIDMCLKLVELHDNTSKTKKTKNPKKPKKTRNKKPKNSRITRKTKQI